MKFNARTLIGILCLMAICALAQQVMSPGFVMSQAMNDFWCAKVNSLASTDLTVTGTTNLTANLKTTGISSGTYSGITVNDKGVATGGTTRSFNNSPGRSLVTTAAAANGIQISETRDAFVSYSIATSTTATIGGASSTTVVLEICSSNSSTAGNWTAISTAANSQTITLAIVLQSIQANTLVLTGSIPAGYYSRLRQTLTGTSSASFSSGQEVLQ